MVGFGICGAHVCVLSCGVCDRPWIGDSPEDSRGGVQNLQSGWFAGGSFLPGDHHAGQDTTHTARHNPGDTSLLGHF